MASCSGTGSNNSSYELELIVTQVSQNVANNETIVNWQLVLKSTGSYSFSTWGSTCVVTINGSNVYNSYSQKDISAYSSITIASGTKTIPHNSDGTKSISFGASYSESSTAYYTAGNINCSGSMTLTTIPRASNVSGGSGNIGDTTTISIDRKSSSFTHTLIYEFDTLSGTIANKTNLTTINWTIPTNFYNALIDSNSGIGTITCTTYNGNTVIGTSTCNFTAKVVNANPVFTNFTYMDSNLNVKTVTGNNQIIVKGLSNLQVTISSAYKMNAQKGALPKNYVVGIDNKNKTVDYNTSTLNIDMGTIDSVGTKRLNVRAYDSRNNSTLVYKDIEVVDYNSPIINAKAERQNNFEDTTTLSVSVNYSPVYVPVNRNGYLLQEAVNNIQIAQYRYRIVGQTWTSYEDLPVLSNTDKIYNYDDILLNLNKANSYEIEIYVKDTFNTIQTEILNVDIGQSIFFISSNKKACYINGEKILTASELYPIGSIYMSVSNTNPSTLFGGTWEQIAKGRTLVGVDTSDSDFSTVKKTGGSKYLQSHTHTMVEAGEHTHSVKFDQVWNTNGGTTSLGTVGNGPYGSTNFVNSGGKHSHTINSSGTGSAGNLQPYFTCYIWCRTA